MAAYPKPNNTTGTFNNQSFVNPDTGGLTIDEAKQYFVTFPNTQSPSTIIANNLNTTGSLNVAGDSQFGGDVEFIGGVNITGLITFENDVEVVGTTTLDDTFLALSTAEIDGELTVNNNIILNYDPAFPTVKTFIQFSDNTVQDTAFVDANYAQKNESNTFEAGFTQTFDGIVDLGDSASASGLTLNNNTLSYLLQPRLSGTNYGLTIINALSNNSILSLSNGGSNVISMTCTGPQALNIAGSVTASSFNIGNSSYFTSGNNTGINNNINGSLNPFIYFAINDLSNVQQIPLYIYWNALLLASTLNMNNNDINNVKNITGNSSSPITINSNITMGTGDNINMNSNSINNISSINANTGGSFTLGNQGSTQCTIAGGSFTAGNSLGINSTNGVTVFNYYTANNLSLNMGTSDTLKIQNTGTSLMELSPTAGINVYKNIGTNGNDISMLGGDIIGCTSITAQAGGYTTTTTPLSTDSSTKIATTAFVKQFAPIYTQSSFTLIDTSPVYYTMSPSPVAVISTYTSGNNTASFNSVPFVLTCQITATFLSFNLQFSTTPFPNYPPPASLYMTVNCSNGATYTCAIAFSSPGNTAFCVLNGGPSPTPGMTFTCNLATIGAFTP